MSVLSIRDLNIYRKADSGRIVRNLDLELGDGESLGIAGESGSGKTVTLRSITGLLPSALYDEFEYKSSGKKISMMFQNPMKALDPLMPVGKMIAEAYIANHRDRKTSGRVLKEEAHDWGCRVLAELGLPEGLMDEKRLPGQLSGGQCQRICAAVALAKDPDILLLDEPTTALDAEMKKRFLDLIKGLRRRYGFSIIFVSHDIMAAADICDRIMIMKDGSVIEEGIPEEILRSPKQPYTRKLASSILL